MAKSQQNRSVQQQPITKDAALDWRPLKKSRAQFIAAGVMLAVWIIFLAAMAAYSQFH